jgi:hypothetical protein
MKNCFFKLKVSRKKRLKIAEKFKNCRKMLIAECFRQITVVYLGERPPQDLATLSTKYYLAGYRKVKIVTDGYSIYIS